MIKCIKIKEGINLYHIDTDKFKTVTASINIHRPLLREEAALNALLCEVLHRGSKKYKTTTEIAKYLQSLYGAGFNTFIRRKGEDQIISLSASIVADRFLNGDNCTVPMLNMMFDILLNPLVQNDAFKPEYVEQEKNNLKNNIEALVNDKRSYAVWRIIELMCKDDNYGVHELGKCEDVDKITPQSLYSHYKKIISQSPIDIFITGSVDISEVTECIKENLKHVTSQNTKYPVCEKYVAHKTIEEVTEKFDVTQAKLCVGFKTDVMPTDPDYAALMVFSGIFGGGAHSKLFNNVREKLSLAYYASSKIERYKGMMIVTSGIEIENKQKALDEIFVQFEDMKKGNISEYEYDSTIKSITNSLEAFGDDIGYCEDYYLGQIVTGTMISLKDYAESIKNVTIDDVIKVSEKIEPQMIYFLTAKD